MSYNLRVCKSVAYKDTVALSRARVARKDNVLFLKEKVLYQL